MKRQAATPAAGGGGAGAPAAANPAAARVPHKPTSKRWRWKDNPAVLYSVPSLLLLAAVFYLVFTTSSPTPPAPSPSSTTPKSREAAPSVLYSADDGDCHPLAVLDDRELHMRVLRCGDCVLGGEYLSANISIFTSSYVQASVALADSLHPPHSPPIPTPTYLIIGLGAGHVASIFHNLFHMQGDVVDRSEAVLRLAASYFAFQPSRRMFAQSAAAFIAALQYDAGAGTCARQGEYDVIAVDIFDATNQLPSLSVYTQSSLRALACTLTARGVLSVALVYSRKAVQLRSPHSLYTTLTSVFEHVVAYTDGGQQDVGNMVFMASHHPFSLDLAALRLPEDFKEEVDVEGADDGRLALQYAVGFWRKQLSRRRFDWAAQPTVDNKGKTLYNPLLLNGQLPDDIGSPLTALSLPHGCHCSRSLTSSVPIRSCVPPCAESTLATFRKWQEPVIAAYHKTAHRMFDYL